jgi:hypothetical protein
MSELRDQFTHCSVALIALAPAVLAPGVLSFAWAGFCLGAVREVTRAGRVVRCASLQRLTTQKLDLSFWTLGGALAGLGA